ncbi:MAG: hypothetical protein HY821_00040 [Acidobacteria bacterium]|nr:hypothetical protein [Acidobacteriota bacterium]
MPYLNVDEVETALMLAAGPPNTAFTELISLPHQTWDGRTCHAIRISAASGSDRVGICFTGGLHAREWGSSDILISLVQRLTDAYRTNSALTFDGKTFAAADIQKIVNHIDLVIFPQVNPDGRHYSQTVDAMWRKNRRPAADPGDVGVDLNRNFDVLWNFPAYFNPAAYISDSTNPASEVYCGPAAASEPETQNVVWLFDHYASIRLFVDVHSHGQLILYPWGDDEDQTADPAMNFQNGAYNGQRGLAGDAAYREFIPACTQANAVTLGTRMRDAIFAVRGKSYTVQQAFALYPTAGTGHDYGFARHFTDATQGQILGFTLEWGAQFQPAYAEMQHILDDVGAGLLEFCLAVLDMHADVMIKDSPADTGAVPSGGAFWSDSDIFLRQNDDDVLAYEDARQGQTNYVYVRVTNLGPNDAQNVSVRLRAAMYPGTEFVYPADWTLVDAAHVEPAAMVNTWASIPAGATRIGKFSLTAAQVNTLFGWQQLQHHPCLLAAVEACNDLGSPAGVHVWENNNLAQRNVTVATADESGDVQFVFVAGHPGRGGQVVHLLIDRSMLPVDALVTLETKPRPRVFPELKAQFAKSLTVLEARQGISRLEAGARERFAIVGRRAVIGLRLDRGIRPLLLRVHLPANAEPRAKFEVRIAQMGEGRHAVGGVTLQIVSKLIT